MKQKLFSIVFTICILIFLSVVAAVTASASTYDIYTYETWEGETTITGCKTSVSGAVTIPDTLGGCPVTTIGYQAFMSCTKMTGVTIPATVTRIDGNAFYDCNSLQTVVIPNSVTRISNGAFSWCTALTDIVIPKSVTEMEYSLFYYCNSLTNIIVEEDNPNYSSLDGILFNKDKSKLICYPGGKKQTSYTVPNGVTAIDACAFQWQENLVSVIIPESVTDLGGSAFESCTNLKNVSIAGNITLIDKFTFYDCVGLTDFVIPDTVTAIGAYAFSGCSSLESIVIPKSVTEVHDYAFDQSFLDNVYYGGARQDWLKISLGTGNTSLAAATIHYAVSTEGTVTYYANGGWGAPKQQSGTDEIILSFEVPKRLGYTFSGWSTVADGVTAEYQPGETVVTEGNLNLYAVWEKTAYLIVNEITMNDMSAFQVTTTGIPVGSMLVLACYQGETVLFVDPVAKISGKDDYYFVIPYDYTSAKILVLNSWKDLCPVIEATPIP